MRTTQVDDHRTAPPRPTPWDSAAAILGAAGLLCELNRSPWIDSIKLNLSNHPQKPMLNAVNEEIEEKMEETEQSGSGAMNKCKKTDGKGWHCKRLAQIPHSLCTYHLAQLRSYRCARFEDHVSGDHRKKSSSEVDYGGSASNYYYYYSILGPWWGKRRGPVNEISERNVDCSGKSIDNEGAACDNDVVEDGESRSEVAYTKKKKRAFKRRGRKPVKARSLKSLL